MPTNAALCTYCGRPVHIAKASSQLWRHECPAFQHSSRHCGHLHHFDNMCHSKGKPKHSPSNKWPSTHPGVPANTVIDNSAFFNQEFNGAVSDSLCILSSSPSAQPSKQSVTLDHHLYNSFDRHMGQTSIKVTNLYQCSCHPLTNGFCCSLSSRSTTLSVMGEVENSEFSENSENSGNSENQFSEVFNSEFSILHYTQNGKLGDENLGVLFQPFYQTPSFSNSEFPILHFTQNGKLGVGNLRVFSKVYQNSDFFKSLNQTPRFSNSEFSIWHYTQNGKLGKL